MTAPGPLASPVHRRPIVATIGTVLWALLPMLTCGFGAILSFSLALARRRTRMTVAGLVAYSLLMSASCGVIWAYGETPPPWADWVFGICLVATSVLATAHLFVIRSAVWAPATRPQVPVAHVGAEAVDRARQLRVQARHTVEADPMLAMRLGIGRPDQVRQFDDGGLVDLNHAPVHVLTTLPGVTDAGARQIRDRVERSGPFESLGEVLLMVEISPSFEHHLREYVVFIP